ncbi:hypothetical protein K435DRAFT_806134 [Dendrothele bispora CBS 962.96]|uniref:Uncharacterized protein n=1 Tax=Dendrothele bispora (strain CBS 962.96) TaxID=1314807 RepID=A0A4S8L8U0_DENBC|nr:hypothetical protein K435DRAFT_806134 [Dendrothele bispora CBS 962.96]
MDGSFETVKEIFLKANVNGRIKFSRTTIPPPFVGVRDTTMNTENKCSMLVERMKAIFDIEDKQLNNLKIMEHLVFQFLILRRVSAIDCENYQLMFAAFSGSASFYIKGNGPLLLHGKYEAIGFHYDLPPIGMSTLSKAYAEALFEGPTS